MALGIIIGIESMNDWLTHWARRAEPKYGYIYLSVIWDNSTFFSEESKIVT